MVINLAFPLFVFDNSQNMKLYIWEKLILLPRGNTAHCSGSLILKCRKMLLNTELNNLFYINHPKHLKHWSNSSNVSSLDKKLDLRSQLSAWLCLCQNGPGTENANGETLVLNKNFLSWQLKWENRWMAQRPLWSNHTSQSYWSDSIGTIVSVPS